MLDNHHSQNDVPRAERASTGIADDLRSLQLAEGERRRPPRSSRRFGRWIIVPLVLGGAVWGGISWLPRWEHGEEVEAVVFSTKAKTDTLLDVTGYLAPRNRISISPEVGGIINAVRIEEGAKVKKGDVLIQIDAERYKADFDQATAALASAQAQWDELKAGSRPQEIDQAKAALEQTRAHMEFLRGEIRRGFAAGIGDGISVSDQQRNISNLHESEATERSQKASLRLLELGPREEKARAAEAEVARARANLDKSRFYYERSRIVAPCDATILERKAEVGEAVHPEVNVTPLCVLANLADLRAEADVQEHDLGILKEAGDCQVIPDAYPDRTYRARFERLQPQINRQRGVVKIKVAILEPDGDLLPDMNCRILFPRNQGSASNSALPVIPEEARIREGEEWVAYVFDGTVARRRVLDCGRTIGKSVEVRGGLRQGEIVFLCGNRSLHDGQAVRPRLAALPAAKRKGE